MLGFVISRYDLVYAWSDDPYRQESFIFVDPLLYSTGTCTDCTVVTHKVYTLYCVLRILPVPGTGGTGIGKLTMLVDCTGTHPWELLTGILLQKYGVLAFFFLYKGAQRPCMLWLYDSRYLQIKYDDSDRPYLIAKTITIRWMEMTSYGYWSLVFRSIDRFAFNGVIIAESAFCKLWLQLCLPTFFKARLLCFPIPIAPTL